MFSRNQLKKPKPRQPDELPPREAPPVTESINQQGDLYRWIAHVDQPAEELVVRTKVREVFFLCESHVKTYYTNTRPIITPSIGSVLTNLQLPKLPGSIPVLDLLLSSPHPITIIAHSLIYIVISMITSDGDVSYPSLLPVEFAAMMQAVQRGSNSTRSIRYFDQAFSAYRGLCAYLRPDIESEAGYLNSRDQKADHVASLFTAAFFPWETSSRSSEQRLKNLLGLLRKSAEFGIFLFYQPSSYRFEWKTPSESQFGLEIIVRPYMFKIRDEEANPFPTPQIISNIKIEHISIPDSHEAQSEAQFQPATQAAVDSYAYPQVYDNEKETRSVIPYSGIPIIMRSETNQLGTESSEHQPQASRNVQNGTKSRYLEIQDDQLRSDVIAESRDAIFRTQPDEDFSRQYNYPAELAGHHDHYQGDQEISELPSATQMWPFLGQVALPAPSELPCDYETFQATSEDNQFSSGLNNQVFYEAGSRSKAKCDCAPSWHNKTAFDPQMLPHAPSDEQSTSRAAHTSKLSSLAVSSVTILDNVSQNPTDVRPANQIKRKPTAAISTPSAPSMVDSSSPDITSHQVQLQNVVDSSRNVAQTASRQTQVTGQQDEKRSDNRNNYHASSQRASSQTRPTQRRHNSRSEMSPRPPTVHQQDASPPPRKKRQQSQQALQYDTKQQQNPPQQHHQQHTQRFSAESVAERQDPTPEGPLHQDDNGLKDSPEDGLQQQQRWQQEQQPSHPDCDPQNHHLRRTTRTIQHIQPDPGREGGGLPVFESQRKDRKKNKGQVEQQNSGPLGVVKSFFKREQPALPK